MITWVTLTTEGFGSPDSRAGMSTLPGISASRRFQVMTTATTVDSRLRLKALACTASTGWVPPGHDATGSGRPAHQTAPPRYFHDSGVSERA